MIKARRRSRREMIATLYSTDIDTFSAYQPGRTRVPVYTEGRRYYVALRARETAPDGFGGWTEAGRAGEYRVFIATGDDGKEL